MCKEIKIQEHQDVGNLLKHSLWHLKGRTNNEWYSRLFKKILNKTKSFKLGYKIITSAVCTVATVYDTPSTITITP